MQPIVNNPSKGFLSNVPVFLLVLCLTTIAASCLQLFISVWRWIRFDEFHPETLSSQVVYIIGAVLMLNLKRIGFFIYLLPKVLWQGYIAYTYHHIIPIYGDVPADEQGFSNGASYVRLILSTAFLIMYCFNYKHLK